MCGSDRQVKFLFFGFGRTAKKVEIPKYEIYIHIVIHADGDDGYAIITIVMRSSKREA